jgi:hypothetical protein
MRKAVTKATPALTWALMVACLCGLGASGQVATFESFSEGSIGTWFLDPASGIIFTNGIDNFGPSVFSVDYGGPTNPPVTPGNYLTGSAYGLGPAIGMTTGFGFTFVLPTPSTCVQMDEFYGSTFAFSIGVRGYSTNGQQVLQTNIPLSIAFPKLAVIHSVLVSAAPMSRVVVITPSNAGVGFDNVGAPPMIRSILATNQTLALSVKNARPQSQLSVSTNFTIWSTIPAEVTNDSGCMVFSVPILGPCAFFRVVQ